MLKVKCNLKLYPGKMERQLERPTRHAPITEQPGLSFYSGMLPAVIVSVLLEAKSGGSVQTIPPTVHVNGLEKV